VNRLNAFTVVVSICLGGIIALSYDISTRPDAYKQDQESLDWDGYIPTEEQWFGKANTFCARTRSRINGHAKYECWIEDGTYFVHVVGETL
jgi:hypothetical protein